MRACEFGPERCPEDVAALLIVIAWWIGAAGFTAWLARDKGRDQVNWFILGVVFGIIALLALGFATRKDAAGPPGAARPHFFEPNRYDPERCRTCSALRDAPHHVAGAPIGSDG